MTPPASLPQSIRAYEETPPVLDMQLIAQLRAMPNGDAMVAELRDLLLDEVAAGLREIRAAITAGDAAVLTRVGHTLKGSCAALGATTFAHLWAAVEQHGHNGAMPEAAALLDALEAERERIRAALDGLTDAR
jgi:HPt (histidine-containing phosphotransfer) domain-containing protein